MSGLHTAHRKFAITTKDKYRDQLKLIWLMKTQINNKKIKYWMINLKDILDLSKQLIDFNKY